MVGKARSLMARVALGAALAASMMFTTSADAMMRRALHVHMKPRLIPATMRPGYVGAAGYPGGPAGPAIPMIVEFPTAGVFTPVGFVGYGTGLATDVVTLGTGVLVPAPGGFLGGIPVLGAIR